jgi:outer membrane lipase/esterase
MPPLRTALAAAALSLAAAQSPAATVNGFTSFIAFGDSLSDPGNLFAATGNTFPPSPPYFNGRFSNGPVWAEYVAERFLNQGLLAANFAFGGANAVPDGVDAIPDLPQQLGTAAATIPPAAVGPKPLVSFWFGANDIFRVLDMPTPTLQDAIEAAVEAADAIGLGAVLAAGAGVGDFLFLNLPDLGRIPRFALFDPTDADKATAAAEAFNLRLATNAAMLRSVGLNVIEIDIDAMFDILLDDPAVFGMTNATTPCFVPGVSLCTPEEALDWAFFDQTHPNSVSHQVIGATVIAAIVPLPASVLMLGAGLAGLGLLRRRRAA